MQNFTLFRIRVLVFALLLLPGFSFSQFQIKGKVFDDMNNEPLIAAIVAVLDGGQAISGSITGENGEFTLTAEIRDGLILRVTYAGYEDYEMKLNPGQPELNLDIRMNPAFMEAVVITAGRHEQKLEDVSISMEIIKPKSIDVQATNDIQDVLQQAPGVDLIDDQPSIRGSSGFAFGVGSRVMVMLDGLPLLSADAAFVQFDVIPTDNIAQVEIMKGASSVLYGSSALGGVINVITADAPKEPMTSIRAKQTLYDHSPYDSADWWWPHRPFTSSINVFHTRRIGNHDFTALVDLIKESGFRKNTDAEKGRVQLFTKFRPKGMPGLNFGANLTYRGDSSSNFLYWDSYQVGEQLNTVGDSSFMGGPFAGDSTLRRQYLSRTALDPFFKYTTAKGNTHNFRSRIFRTVNTNDTQQGSKNLLVYNDYQHSMRIWKDKVNWVVGGTFTFARSFSDSLYGGGECINGDSVVLDTSGKLFHYSINSAVYTQLDGKLTARLNVMIGARFDYFLIDGNEKEMSPIFRVGMNYNTWPGGNVRASFGQAFRSPSIAERFTTTTGGSLFVTANPCLEVEKGYSAEVAFRQGFKFGTIDRGGMGFADIAAFIMDYNNMIEFGAIGATGASIFDPGVPIFSTLNVADAQISGLEFTALWSSNLGDFRADLSGGFTYMEPRNLNPVPDSLQMDIRSGEDILGQMASWLGFLGDSNRIEDNPAFLKYRNRTMARASLTLGYGKFDLTANVQFKSEVKHIDEFLFIAIQGALEYANENGMSTTLLNLIAAYDIRENLKLSFHVNNLTNARWVMLPGIVGEQRRFTAQVKYVF